jgi:signal transduction histidine kinase
LDQGPGFWGRTQAVSGFVLVSLACLVLAYGLWWAPRQLAENLAIKMRDDFQARNFENGQKVERHWMALPLLHSFRTGNEPAVKQFLVQQPLVVAMLDRLESRTIWVKKGDRLVKGEEGPLVQLYRAWITQAEVAQRFQWTPGKDHDPDSGKLSSVVLLGDNWIAIKRWNPGSPEVEAALHQIFGHKAPLRMALEHQKEIDAGDTIPKQPWGAEPHYQVDARRVNDTFYWFAAGSDAFGEGWNVVGIPWQTELDGYKSAFRRQKWLSRGIAILIAAALSGGLWLRRRARQREQLDADRMAGLTHSLKTPLAVLKFRCDSLRLGRLEEEQAAAELLRLGEEVDNLTQMIENGLAAIRGDAAQGPQREVSPVWLVAVADDLEPAYEADNRTLELRLSDDSGWAALASLRPVLLTLLENALFHGAGTVILESWRKGRRFYLRVSDQGPGVDATQLAVLGKPFMRLRRHGKEGFTREGQGLGLSLLCQMAQREGWGLRFESAPGRGFHVTLILEALREPTGAAG